MDEIDELIASYGSERVESAVSDLVSIERKARIVEVLSKRLASVTVVLERLYDPRNGAAVLRSAECLGIQDAHVVDGARGTFQASEDVTKGCHKWMRVSKHPGSSEAMSELRGRGFLNVATTPSAAITLGELKADKPLAIWFGNEKDGLSDEALRGCDVALKIPMFGFSESFNLSVAVALTLREVCTRRRRILGRDGDLDPKMTAYLKARWMSLGIRGIGGVVTHFVSKLPPEYGKGD